MEKLTLIRETTAHGEVEITLNGNKLNYELSRKLTWTTDEMNFGVFNDGDTAFRFGKHKKVFEFGNLNIKKAPLRDIAAELKSRIEKIRTWVQSFQNTTEKIEFTLSGHSPGYIGEVTTEKE